MHLGILLIMPCEAEERSDVVDISPTKDIYSLERVMVDICRYPRKIGSSEFMSIFFQSESCVPLYFFGEVVLPLLVAKRTAL